MMSLTTTSTDRECLLVKACDSEMHEISLPRYLLTNLTSFHVNTKGGLFQDETTQANIVAAVLITTSQERIPLFRRPGEVMEMVDRHGEYLNVLGIDDIVGRPTQHRFVSSYSNLALGDEIPEVHTPLTVTEAFDAIRCYELLSEAVTKNCNIPGNFRLSRNVSYRALGAIDAIRNNIWKFARRKMSLQKGMNSSARVWRTGMSLVPGLEALSESMDLDEEVVIDQPNVLKRTRDCEVEELAAKKQKIVRCELSMDVLLFNIFPFIDGIDAEELVNISLLSKDSRAHIRELDRTTELFQWTLNLPHSWEFKSPYAPIIRHIASKATSVIVNIDATEKHPRSNCLSIISLTGHVRRVIFTAIDHVTKRTRFEPWVEIFKILARSSRSIEHLELRGVSLDTIRFRTRMGSITVPSIVRKYLVGCTGSISKSEPVDSELFKDFFKYIRHITLRDCTDAWRLLSLGRMEFNHLDSFSVIDTKIIHENTIRDWDGFTNMPKTMFLKNVLMDMDDPFPEHLQKYNFENSRVVYFDTQLMRTTRKSIINKERIKKIKNEISDLLLRKWLGKIYGEQNSISFNGSELDELKRAISDTINERGEMITENMMSLSERVAKLTNSVTLMHDDDDVTWCRRDSIYWLWKMSITSAPRECLLDMQRIGQFTEEELGMIDVSALYLAPWMLLLPLIEIVRTNTLNSK